MVRDYSRIEALNENEKRLTNNSELLAVLLAAFRLHHQRKITLQTNTTEDS